jgi:hypothetical protein
LRNYVASINCEPGFLKDVLEVAQKNFSADVYNLVIDGIHIKNQIVMDNNNKVHGYCDFGGVVINKPDERATESLVFMSTSLKGKFFLSAYPVYNLEK